MELIKGRVSGDAHGLSLFAVCDGRTAGLIQAPDGRCFLIAPSEDGRHLVLELDDEAPSGLDADEILASVPGEAPPAIRFEPGGFRRSAMVLKSATAGAGARPVIDIMVLYSTTARERTGGQSGLRSLIALNLGFLNCAWVQSGVAAESRLIHSAEITWRNQSSSAVTEVTLLDNDSRVRALREQYGADLVSELGCGFTDSVGCSFLGGSSSVCAAGNPWTFAHEIGHNLGARHDRPNAAGATAGYAYGYSFLLSGVRYGTIMSYLGLRIPFFSNPEICWEGVPLGIPETLPNAANNVRMLNENAPLIAAWKVPKGALLVMPRFVSSSTFAFDLAGPPGTYVVEYTADYLNWNPLGTAVLQAPSRTITDASAGSAPQRFYRAKTTPGEARLASQVGFIKRRIPTGYTMLGNQLNAGDHRIAALWPNPPSGLLLYKYDPGRKQYRINSASSAGWLDPQMSLAPGEGAIAYNPGAALTLTFTGEVWPGFGLFLPRGNSIVCSPVPQAGPVSTRLGLPFGQSGDAIYRLMGPQLTYRTYTSTGGSWTPGPEPSMGFGEAFWVKKLSMVAANENNLWSRSFWTWP